MAHLSLYSKFASSSSLHNVVRCRNANTCVLGVTEVFRLAFAHFCELRTQICAMDSQMPELFTYVGIISVA